MKPKLFPILMSWLLILITGPASAPNQVMFRAGLTTGVSLKLSAGWTWFSLNVENADMSIGHVLESLTPSEGDYIKNQTVSSTFYEGYGWFGELLEIDPCETYKIKLVESDSLIMEGLPADPQSHPITIKAGWNWIGYLPQSAQPLSEALACINPVSDDYIKNQTSSGTWYDGYGWFGELSEMAPLDGYMLKTSHAGTLIYAGLSSCSFTDARDGRSYACVEIGTQTWMAENLAWLPEVSPSAAESSTSPYYYVYGYEGFSVSDAKATGNYSTYGVLYNWPAAMHGASGSNPAPGGVQGICPDGWHLPGDEEWLVLGDYLIQNGYGYLGTGAIAKSLASTTGWVFSPTPGTVGNDQAGNNGSGFNALPGGYRTYFAEGFTNLGTQNYFWSNTGSDPSRAWSYSLYYQNDAVSRNSEFCSIGMSVRCVKNNPDSNQPPTACFTVDPSEGPVTAAFQFDASGSSDTETPVNNLEVRWDWTGDGTWDTGYSTTKPASHQYMESGTYLVILEIKDGNGLTDTETKTVIVTGCGETFTDGRDGQVYSSVTIGTQTWMAQNLAWLPSVGPSTTGSGITPYYYVYGYEGTSVIAARANVNFSIYGVLYNWPAVMDGASASNSVPSGVQGICPSGWHVPSNGEWDILTDFLTGHGFGYEGSGSDIAKSMAAPSRWVPYSEAGTPGNDQTGNNQSCFTARPGGHNSVDGGAWGGPGFMDINNNVYFWSTSERDESYISVRFMSYADGLVHQTGGPHRYGFPVRCVKDASNSNQAPAASFTIDPAEGCVSTNFQFDASLSTDPETSPGDLEVRWDWTGDGTWDTEYSTAKTASHQHATAGTYTVILEVKDAGGLKDTESKTVTVTDAGCCGTFTDNRDGNIYSMVQIGTQCWMAENLAWLPAVSPSSEGSGNSPCYYVYNYEGTNVSEAKAFENFATYGVLYNWEASRTACPSGWHLPTDEEWKVLEKNQGMTNSDADATGWRNSGTVGGKLKETGTAHWNSQNTGATNASGFTALPGGNSTDAGFTGLGIFAHFWSASGGSSGDAWERYLGNYSDGVYRVNFIRYNGFSVRCLRDDADSLSVPYALFSERARTVIDEKQSLSLSANQLTISGTGGNTVTFTGWDTDATNDVTTTSDQIIAGNKTFTGTVTVPAPVNPTDIANKAYVDSQIDALLNQLSELAAGLKDIGGNNKNGGLPIRSLKDPDEAPMKKNQKIKTKIP